MTNTILALTFATNVWMAGSNYMAVTNSDAVYHPQLRTVIVTNVIPGTARNINEGIIYPTYPASYPPEVWERITTIVVIERKEFDALIEGKKRTFVASERELSRVWIRHRKKVAETWEEVKEDKGPSGIFSYTFAESCS